MVNVSINGYGTIGKRVADGVSLHSKLKLIGVSKYTPDGDARLANMLGYGLFVPGENKTKFTEKGIEVEGDTNEMIDESDVIVDASSGGRGIQNRQNFYSPKDKKAIFQGGEDAEVADISFNARSNFERAIDKKYIRVVSCNTTSYCRLIKPLMDRYKIKNIQALLIRRGADPNDSKGAMLNAVEWKAKSHHADDVKTVIDVPISSIAYKVPHTLTHVNSMNIEFEEQVNQDAFIDIFKDESRVAILNSAKTSAEIIEAARDLGLKRYDTFVVSLLMKTFVAEGNRVFVSFLVPQESIVIPENIDAIVGQAGLMKKEDSMKTTDKILGIPEIKKNLEKIFE